MKYDKTISAIERDLNLKNHFTDYDFGEILNIKCPRPEVSERLRNNYFRLMSNLKIFLGTEPENEAIQNFVLNEYKQLDSQHYLKEEFLLLTLKYNGFLYFILGGVEIKTYYDQIENKLVYFNLTDESSSNDGLTPLVKSLSGVIDLPENYQFKPEYFEYLKRKYN